MDFSGKEAGCVVFILALYKGHASFKIRAARDRGTAFRATNVREAPDAIKLSGIARPAIALSISCRARSRPSNFIAGSPDAFPTIASSETPWYRRQGDAVFCTSIFTRSFFTASFLAKVPYGRYVSSGNIFFRRYTFSHHAG